MLLRLGRIRIRWGAHWCVSPERSSRYGNESSPGCFDCEIPGPLGLSGFALTTFVLSLFNSGILDASHLGIVIGFAVAYGGLAQFVAGMWEFRTGNTFGATAFTSYGAFWISFALILVNFGLVKGVNAPDNIAVGWYLIAWGIFTGLMALGSFKTNVATAVVFVLLFATFIVLGVGDLQNVANIIHVGGFIGLATAVAAWYTALAGVLTGVNNGKAILPVFPLNQRVGDPRNCISLVRRCGSQLAAPSSRKRGRGSFLLRRNRSLALLSTTIDTVL